MGKLFRARDWHGLFLRAEIRTWTSPATPSSIVASAPCLLNLMTTPWTSVVFFIFFFRFVPRILFQRFDGEGNFSVFDFNYSYFYFFADLEEEFRFSTSPQSISEIWTNPSRPSAILTKAPNQRCRSLCLRFRRRLCMSKSSRLFLCFRCFFRENEFAFFRQCSDDGEFETGVDEFFQFFEDSVFVAVGYARIMFRFEL